MVTYGWAFTVQEAVFGVRAQWVKSFKASRTTMLMSVEVYGGVLEWFSLSQWCASEKKEDGSRFDTGVLVKVSRPSTILIFFRFDNIWQVLKIIVFIIPKVGKKKHLRYCGNLNPENSFKNYFQVHI